MAETHDIHRVYITTLRYPDKRNAPLIERGWTIETETPYRRGSSIVFRMPGSRHALVLGVWGSPQDEDEALRAAIGMRELTPEETRRCGQHGADD